MITHPLTLKKPVLIENFPFAPRTPNIVLKALNEQEKKISVSFEGSYHKKYYTFDQLLKYIDPSLCFPKSYTLNETFRGCQFYTTRKENITIRTKKAVGIIPVSSGCRYVKKTIEDWESKEELKEYFGSGMYHIEENEIEAVRYYFRLNGSKTANYIMREAKTAKKLREERTQCLINEMTEEDKIDVLERLADYYGYFLE